ncbi:prolyl-tRNA synthetase associated domain-containing protein [bacterium]|nr:prolyl-tRNA synthetase associated domain-containing protein [bacterium]
MKNHLTASDQFFAFLKINGIKSHTIKHKAVFTMGEGENIFSTLEGAHSKSLFLKTRNKELLLVVVVGTKKLNLNVLEKKLGVSRLSFGSGELMEQTLGVTPGTASPFCFINESAKDVKLIIDKELTKFDLVNFHPLSNEMTTTMSTSDFFLFLDKVTATPLVMEIPTK